MKTMTLTIFALLLISLPGFAGADNLDIDRTAYIPHLTGNVSGWNDFLVVNNKGPQQETFTLTLYNAGLQVAQEGYLVQPNEEKTIDLKALNSNATLGKVDYSSEYLTFRVTFGHTNGGVAEFRLSDDVADQVMFNFSNVFADLDWKGIAVANFENFTTNVTIYAIGSNRQVLDSTVVSLTRLSRLVGFYTEWFPNININDINAIVVRSSEAKVAGVTIAGGPNNTTLLFTASTDATTFTDGSFPNSVAIRDYFPIRNQSGTYTATDDVTISYSGSGNYFYITLNKAGAFMRAWYFYFDDNANLRYYYTYYPMGYAYTNDYFTIVPAQVDLNRKYTYNESWDYVYRYNGNSSNEDVAIDTLVQGPYYVVVPAGNFEDVVKLSLREQSQFTWWNGGDALSYETVTFWLDKSFGIVKMKVNDFEFEVESMQNN